MSRYDVRIAEDPLFTGAAQYFVQPGAPKLHGLESVANELRPILREVVPGDFLLARDQFEALDEATTKVQIFDCEEFYYGRHKNTHGLTFGQLALTTEVDRGKQVYVAVKPFDTIREALHEYAAIRYINGFRINETRPLAFQPLGFQKTETGGLALLTEYDPTVTSFDNVFWDVEHPPKPEEVAKALGYCVTGLARLHAYGLFADDAQVKNHAADNIGPRYIDLEAVRPFPRGDESEGGFDVEQVRFGIEQDIEKFVNSLSTGVEDPEEAPDYRPQLEVAFKKYPHYVRHPSSLVPDAAIPTKSKLKTIIDKTR